MAYQVLARKWRPRLLTEMVGQESVLRILQNALTQQRIHHAYLFSGTRGVGKTTLGRILARCLNCEQGITPSPCGQCATCVAIDKGQFLDLYEVDAASRTKVEDTRELLDNVLYSPTQGRFKIYLIDEVHMLSNHSFNALLKTLEEPPSYVKFILATTEPKRLPATILSRCLQFHLQHISVIQISRHLQHICKTEQIEYDEIACTQLAHAAAGSMRDALSLLDQAIAFGQGSLKHEEVAHMLGSIGQDDLFPLLEALATQDGACLFKLLPNIMSQTSDFTQLLDALSTLLHQIAMQQIVPNAEANEKIKQLSQAIAAEDIQIFYQISLLGKKELGLAPTPQQGFEMTLLRMLAFKPSLFSKTNHSPITALSTPSSQANLKHTAAIKTEIASSSKNTLAKQKEQEPPKTKPSEIPKNSYSWREILPQLSLSGMSHALASNCTLLAIHDTSVELAISTHHEPMLNAKLKDRIEQALIQFFNRPLNLEIKVTSDELYTPEKQEQEEKENRLKAVTTAILENPQVKHLIETCNATVDVALVEA